VTFYNLCTCVGIYKLLQAPCTECVLLAQGLWDNWTASGAIFLKTGIGLFFENVSNKFKFD